MAQKTNFLASGGPKMQLGRVRECDVSMEQMAMTNRFLFWTAQNGNLAR